MEKTAAIKAKLYSRFGKEIFTVAKQGGPDPDANLALRRIIERAKKAQVPADVIKRAIDKVKSGATENYETMVYEGYGPNGSTIIVECMTDNVNRTLSQVRPAFTKSKSKLAASGAVAYAYDTISIVAFKGLDEEQALEALFSGEVDAKDIEAQEDGTVVITGEPTDLYAIKTAIEAACPEADFSMEEITRIPQEYVELAGEDLELFERLMTLLNDCDDVDTIYHNVTNVN